MDFAEDYKCRSQNEVRFAYWSQIQVTIHPVVMYYKKNRKLKYRSFVFVSNESRHDARIVYTLIQKIISLLKAAFPNLEMIHYWRDSTTSQYQNKTILKIICCHDEHFGCKASWSYMESGHGKGPCDSIGGTAKRKADQGIKIRKICKSRRFRFYEWSKSNSTTITCSYIPVEDYENSEKFLQAICDNIRRVPDTMILRAIHSIKSNTVWIRNTACFCNNCFNTSFQPATCCNGSKEFSATKPTKTVKPKRDKKDNKKETRGNEEKPYKNQSNQTSTTLLLQFMKGRCM